MIVATETAYAANAGTLAGYSSKGVTTVKWTVGGQPCPDCAALDGTEYPIEAAPDMPAHPHCGCSLTEVPA
jgi:hypothetical protein